MLSTHNAIKVGSIMRYLSCSLLVAVLLPLSSAKAVTLGPKTGFDYAALIARAEAASKTPYAPPGKEHDEALKTLTGEIANTIYFKGENALWADEKGAPQIRFFHRMTWFRERLRYWVVEGNQAREVLYEAKNFDYGTTRLGQTLPKDLGYAGFRVMNTKDPETDWMAFLGASYFRTAAPFDQYGLSARGVAIDSGFQDEEFPRFNEMWFERRGDVLRIYAYMDGPSVVGVVRYDVRHGTEDVMDIEETLFVRKPIRRIGLAPLTSMYWYGERDRRRTTDWHPESHDSDFLVIRTESGEQIARPLQSPASQQVTTFVSNNVKAFGLLQRDRDPEHYLDEMFRYELRGSAWIEPTKPFGNGSVLLLENPTDADVNDNMVTYWVPAEPMVAGKKIELAYRLTWCDQPPNRPSIAEVYSTRTGWGGVPATPEVRRFAVEFQGGALEKMSPDATLIPVVTTPKGTVERPSVKHVPGTKRWRALFDIRGGGREPFDVRMYLKHGTGAVSETWLYQYRPGDDG